MSCRPANFVSVLSVTLAALLAGCSLLGEKEQEPLPGKRISVVQLQRGLKVTPGLSSEQLKLPLAVRNTTWPMTGGIASHALSHVEGPKTFSQAWSVSAGAGTSANAGITAEPIIADGRVYVKDARSRITAMDASTGKQIWSIDLTPRGESSDSGFGGGVAYADRRLFAVTAYGFAVALDPATGEEIWRREVGVPFRAPPMAAVGRLVATTIDNQVLAFDFKDGRVLWNYQGISEAAGLLKGGSPAARSDLVVVPFSSGEIIGLRMVNGAFVWGDNLARTGRTTPIGTIGAIAGSPVIAQGAVFALSHSGRMTATNAQTGQRLWGLELSGTQTPWIAGDHVFVVSGDAEVSAIQAGTGDIRWITALERYSDPEGRTGLIGWNGPVLVDGQLLFTSSNGQMLWMDPGSGAVIGSQEIPDTSVPPVVAGGTVYILTDDGDLIAYR